MRLTYAVVSSALLTTVPASASSIVIGADTFVSTAFADSIVSFSGPFVFAADSPATPTTVGEAVLGADVFTSAEGAADGAFVQVSFDDNVAFNRPGADIVLFELSGLGATEDFVVRLTPGGTEAQTVITATTGITFDAFASSGSSAPNPSQVNRGLLDLSDLGIAEGDFITSLTIELWSNRPPDLAAVAALHIPSPAGVMILGAAAVGLGSRRRR